MPAVACTEGAELLMSEDVMAYWLRLSHQSVWIGRIRVMTVARGWLGRLFSPGPVFPAGGIGGKASFGFGSSSAGLVGRFC